MSETPNNKQIRVVREVALEWQQVIRIAEKVGYGSFEIVIQEGLPKQVNYRGMQKLGIEFENELKEKLKTIPLL